MMMLWIHKGTGCYMVNHGSCRMQGEVMLEHHVLKFHCASFCGVGLESGGYEVPEFFYTKMLIFRWTMRAW